MSYHSVHMNHPIKGGYRRSKIRPTTVAELSCLTWSMLRGPEVLLNGNTKFQEMPIVAFFFKNGFIDRHTQVDIGYTSSPRSGAIRWRLDKVNTQELLSFGIKLMMSGLLKKDWAWILDPERKPTRYKYSKYRITFSKAICEQAVEKYGYTKVSMKLRVDMKVIAFWLNYDN